MTWIKICGITSPAAAELVSACHPSAIGLNFYEPSPRYLSIVDAKATRDAIPDGIEVIGVFVNESPNAVAAIANKVGLTGVQLHGDEAPGDLRTLEKLLPNVVLCKAFRIGADGMRPVRSYLNDCKLLEARPDRILVDARVAGVYGGSGKRVDWSLVDQSARGEDFPPMILAGGLTPDNVADAISATNPWGVDTASGVENEAGEKDVQMTIDFISAARQ